MSIVTSHVDFLVTGANGFVGSAVTELLLSKGYSVRALVRDPQKGEVLAQKGVSVVLGDLNNIDALREAVRNVSCILHIGALFRQAGLPSSEFFRVNVEGTRLLIECAVEAGVPKMVHCSTVGVHGHIQSPPADETTPYNPGDPYQESKMQGEQVFLEAVHAGKIHGVVIRPAMIFGPKDSRTLKIFKPIAQGRFFYVGKGDALVHFVDVRDLAESFLLAATKDGINGEVFIIAGETSLPLRELAGIISELMGVKKPWIRIPAKPMQMLGSLCETICTPLKINPPLYRRRVDFFTKDRCFNVTKAHTFLGFRPKRSLVQELSEIIESYVEAGMIPAERLKHRSVLLRAASGAIKYWRDSKPKKYGWETSQIVGELSHSVFSTEFLTDLPKINQELLERGEWSGPLVQKNKAGETVNVKSTWKLLPFTLNSEPLILEVNEPL
jgi:nucleoside-diphosphate-sugar epimerase